MLLLARHSAERLAAYDRQDNFLLGQVQDMRADFYNYDDQMNMYVAVLEGTSAGKAQLAETTYDQAVGARRALGQDLSVAATRRSAAVWAISTTGSRPITPPTTASPTRPGPPRSTTTTPGRSG